MLRLGDVWFGVWVQRFFLESGASNESRFMGYYFFEFLPS